MGERSEDSREERERGKKWRMKSKNEAGKEQKRVIERRR